MKSSVPVFIVLLVACVTSAAVVSPTDIPEVKDPCPLSTEIDSDNRVVSDETVPGTRCDKDWDEVGWYKFVINGQPTSIPTTCIKPQSCGSHIALRVELDGAELPANGDEIDAWSCGAYDVLGKYDCCVLRLPIRIRNCSTFLAYRLPRPDRCSVSYCVQDVNKTIPLNVRVKTGEDVIPGSTTASATTASALAASATASATASASASVTFGTDLFKKHCLEGLFWCDRLPGCTSFENCKSLPEKTTDSPLTTSYPGVSPHTNTEESDVQTTSPFPGSEQTDIVTESTDTPITTILPVEESSVSSHVTNETSSSQSATTSTAHGTSTDNIEGETTLLVEEMQTTASKPETTVVRQLFPETVMYTTAAAATVHSTSLTTATTESGASETNTSKSRLDEVHSTASVPGTSKSTIQTDTTVVYNSSQDVHVSSVQQTTTVVTMTTRDTKGVNVENTSPTATTSTSVSISEILAESTSSLTTVDQTSSSARAFHTTATPSVTSLPSTKTTVSVVTHPVGGSTTPPYVDGRIVMEFINTKAGTDYRSQIKAIIPGILNDFYKPGKHLSHTYTQDDIDVTEVERDTDTTVVVFRVTRVDEGVTVTEDAGELIQMLLVLDKNEQLNNQGLVDSMGTVVAYYRYGDRPAKKLPSTSPPSSERSKYSLFYDKLPLFIAIIVMTTGCLLICLFGLVYLRFYRRQQTWNTQKDMERARLKDNRVKEGLENPVQDSEMLKDEYPEVRETTLTSNGAHPPPSLPVEEEKGWVVPIDQAPESLREVALRTEDTKL